MFGWFRRNKKTGPEEGAEGQTPGTEYGKVSDSHRLAKGLDRTRKSFMGRLNDLFSIRKKIDRELLEDLEEILITADLGVGITAELLEEARQMAGRDELAEPSAIRKILQDRIAAHLATPGGGRKLEIPEAGPLVIMVLGVNGVGKTTSIGKMANKFVKAGQKVLLVAADTFRAAAAEQLQIWGERIGVEVVAKEAGADPSSVIYDALEPERCKDKDVIIVDTAGRMHTKVNLVEELKKIKRVMGKKIPGAPHEVLLVIDATTGQNAISQARMFNDAVDVTGLVLTKLDGTAKGGIVVNICREFDIPIRFIGIGEQLDDLRDFDADEFAEALFGPEQGEE
ncbi:MAG: signal recognition particle-docking protein FtsY [Proteobacteria bacterium]|nr:signal recognition particle-docking protein FtsY [Pseudomonadota bacterium]MBU1739858.1 signal recognition particle-docking protein FtsY [Pseudomonadota bacterium]